MNSGIVIRPEKSIDVARIDAIVGSYAAIGAADLRRRRLRSWALAACMLTVVGAAILGQPTWLFPFLRTADFETFRTNVEARLDGSLGQLEGGLGRLEGGLGRIENERAALETQREQINTQLAVLSDQLTAFERQSARWEQQRVQLEQQSDALLAAMEVVRQERDSMHEELAVDANPAALDALLEEFSIEELAIDTELETLQEHRRAVELQREQLEREKADLEALLFGDNSNDASARGAPDMRDPAIVAVADMMGAAPTDLENSRAGIRFGDGMSVTLGLTQSASVNGVEQLSNSVDLGNFSTGIDWSTMQIGMGGIVLQNGTANSIAPGALESLSSGFGTYLQNSLDDQLISTETIYDLRIEDVSRAIGGISAGQALEDSLRFQQ
jgi:hypothetical protein